MFCQVCNSKVVNEYTVVENVPIYQCQGCQLAFVDQKTPRKKTTHIYSFLDYQKRENQFIKRYQSAIKLIKKCSDGKKILEVGAGFGLFSGMLYKAGYSVDALEPTVTPHYLQDLSVKTYKQNLEEYTKNTTNKYDVIILYDVLEHVDFPQKTIRLFEKLLINKGIVFIQTPNYQSLMARIVRNWSWWMVEDHRYFFSRKSLNLLFKNENWSLVFSKTYEEWPDFKKNLDGNFTNKIHKALFFGWFIPFYFLFKRFIWGLGYGGLHVAIWQYNRE